MPHRNRWQVAVFASLVIASTGTLAQVRAQDEEAKQDFFEKKIRPVLVEHCYECHSSESKTIQGGLSVDSRLALARGGDSGPALVPGKSDTSLLVDAIRYGANQMPPKGKLPDNVIADFVRWVDSGAVDPREDTPIVSKKEIDFIEARQFWSFKKPNLPAIPETSRTGWAKNAIDRFTLAAMEVNRVTPVAAAGKRELLRRATFDLTGLPPTTDEIEAFLADSSSEAFANVIDRLLQSQSYGERWGRYWLDIARYSEDQAHTFSVQPNTSGYRYRDWVIAAFNSDMPFDRFVKLQIAADLVEGEETERIEHLAALGYFGLGAQYYKNSDAAKAAADELDDRIDTLTRGFLGLTVSCARCHDHKFDPIPQQDYYSLAGVFQSSRLHNAPLAPQSVVEQYNSAQQKIKKLDEAITQTIAKEGPKIREARIRDVSGYLLGSHKFRVEKTRNDSLKLAEFATSEGLEEKTLKRWIDFLNSKTASQSQVLKPWFDAVADSTSKDEVLKAAANSVEQFLGLLLRERDGKLSETEKSQLAMNKQPSNARFVSPMITKKQPTIDIDIELNGAKELILVVNDGGNGPSCDHADWLEPKLKTQDGEILLTDLKWRSVKTTYGNVNLNANVNGQPLRVSGKSYANGIGTHSTSIISYDLPEGTTRFQAIGGMDQSGSDQGGCGENAIIQFRVYTETPNDTQEAQPDLIAEVFGDKGIFALETKELEQRLPESTRTLLESQRKELEQVRRDSPAMYPIAHTIAESNVADMKVMIRGNPANQGEVAPRRFLKILSDDNPQPFTKGSGRLELAESIASDQNPLTARVIVNRVWQHHFGRGLVGTPDNFGKLGEAPSHPELLDYLTFRFIENGWSIKSLHREMMLSATYQLATERNEANMQLDADNRYLWRMNRRRLDVEAWRDALLFVSGRLDKTLQGASTNLADSNNTRRTVYAFISRHELDNTLRLFDFPDANITSSTRTETTVPQQQLFVINSPFMIEQSKAFAKRVMQESSEEDTSRIRRAFEVAYGRPVTEPELQMGLRYLSIDDSEDEKKATSLTRWERYAQVLLGSNEFLYLD